MIGMREREISHMATSPESLMHSHSDLMRGEWKEGLVQVASWSFQDHRQQWNIKQESEGHTRLPPSHRLAAIKSVKECSKGRSLRPAVRH